MVWLLAEALLADVEIVARVERRRKWTAAEKAALLAEIDAEGGKVTVVARRHRMPESVLYNWRSARKAAMEGPSGVDFVPVGVFGGATAAAPARLPPPEADRREPSRASREGAGAIEITLPNGARVCVDAFVNETALARVLRAIRSLT
jgi:transposase